MNLHRLITQEYIHPTFLIICSLSNAYYKAGLVWANLNREIKRVYVSQDYVYSKITPHAGSSPSFEKKETIDFVCETLPDRDIKILDVGPGRGVYNALLKKAGYL
ncbi:MAG: hypothetical protein LBU98_04010, partial [Alistipes sp.]|nr:hypothetical protein [Alistipes sp.]